VNGVAESATFVLMAVKDYFSRPSTLFELSVAKILEKTIVVIREKDDRHGGGSFEEVFASVSKEFKSLVDHEVLETQRRARYYHTFLSSWRGHGIHEDVPGLPDVPELPEL